MVCDVMLNSVAEKDLIVVPNSAVSKDNGGKSFVYLVSSDNKSVKKQIVEVGNYQRSGVAVLSGLSSNQTIVVEGKEKLSDNSLISL